jgi:MFS family permease
MAQIALPTGRDIRIVGLISFGHMLSHFYFLVVVPIVPLIKADIDASYLGFGAVIGCFGFASFVLQTPVGFLVDRFSATRLLVWGLLVESVCIALMGFATSIWHLFGLYFVAGIANTVFHPADYAILARSIDQSRVGRAFSVHLFSGNVGFALAPIIMAPLATLLDWHAAFHIAGIIGVAFALYLWTQQRFLEEAMEAAAGVDPAKKKEAEKDDGKSSLDLLFSFPILMCLVFFVFVTLGFTGIKVTFVVAVGMLYDMALDAANAGLTGFLVGSAAGVLAGGYIADRYGARRSTAVITLGIAGILIAAIGTVEFSPFVVVAAISLAGFMQGILMPSRDVLVRNVTPDGSMGKVIGFLSSGLMGASFVVPILFGWLLDHGMPSWIFWLSGIFIVAAIFSFSTAKEGATRT